MDHFDHEGGPSYIDFIKVLTSEAGSPKKYGPRSSSSAPLYARVQNAMMTRPLDSYMLKEMFLPSDVMEPNETIINFKEMETVFSVDLDIVLEPQVRCSESRNDELKRHILACRRQVIIFV